MERVAEVSRHGDARELGAVGDDACRRVSLDTYLDQRAGDVRQPAREAPVAVARGLIGVVESGP
jgi:hypothetical protein